jgi:Alpha amylase, catalytic domain
MFPLVYELDTRRWLRELSERSGERVTLANVPKLEFETWRDLGFTHLWLMGVWTTGPRSRAVAPAAGSMRQIHGEAFRDFKPADIAGSPYAIADYRVADELGGESGLREFRERLHAAGMRLLLDFVPNHVGLDHPWVEERPHLFVQPPLGPSPVPGTFASTAKPGANRLAHGRDPYFPPWADTAQLDYRVPAARDAMREELLAIAGRCDGVRCDMAMLILNEVFARTWREFPSPAAAATSEFWRDAISAVKAKRPDFLMLAEAYWGLESRLQALGFDYTYDKTPYDELIRRNPAGLQRHLLEAPLAVIAAGAHFLENHDERRIASLLAPDEHRAAALLMLALPGLRLLYEGQLEGAVIHTPVQALRRPVEIPRLDIAEIYRTLLRTLRGTSVGRGTSAILRPRAASPGNPTAANFVLIQWQASGLEFDLAVVNLAPDRGQCFAPLSVDRLAQHDWAMRDLLGAEQYHRPGVDLRDRGLYLDVPAHAAQLFHFQPVR